MITRNGNFAADPADLGDQETGKIPFMVIKGLRKRYSRPNSFQGLGKRSVRSKSIWLTGPDWSADMENSRKKGAPLSN